MQMKTNDEIIEIIKRTVLDYLPDAEVLLFGSHARKNASLDSDYDILLITDFNFLPKEKLPIRTISENCYSH